MARYSDEFRAQVIALLDGANYYENKTQAVNQVYKYLQGKVPKRTLFRWGNRENRPAPAKLVTEKKGNMADALEELTWALIDHAAHPDVIESMSGREASTSIGTYIDKIRLLRGLPTEIIEVIPGFVDALAAMGKDPKEFMTRVIERANADYLQ